MTAVHQVGPLLELPETAKQFLSPAQIAELVGSLAAHLDQELDFSDPLRPPMVIGVLPEGLMTSADTIRRLSHVGAIELGFLSMTNKRVGTTGQELDPRALGTFPRVEGRDVHLLHTRMCSGASANHLAERAERLGARSVRHATLLYQPAQRMYARPSFAAMEIDPGIALFGYGLSRSRLIAEPSLAHLDAVYSFDPERERQLEEERQKAQQQALEAAL